MYEKISWKNHIVTNPDTYTMTNNADNTVTLEPAPGTIVQQGTQVNAENLGQMDNGIYILSQTVGDEELDEVLADTVTESLNDLARPDYTEATSNQNLVPGESYKKAFGKISKAIRSFIAHLSASNPHSITCDTIGAVKTNNLTRVDYFGTDLTDATAMPVGTHWYNGYLTYTGTPPFTNNFGVWIRQKQYVSGTGTEGLIDLVFNTSTGEYYSRTYNSSASAFNDWVKFDCANNKIENKGIANGADFDDLKGLSKVGVYWISNTSNFTNPPLGSAQGYLIVMNPTWDSVRTVQKFICANGMEYSRFCSESTWTNWTTCLNKNINKHTNGNTYSYFQSWFRAVYTNLNYPHFGEVTISDGTQYCFIITKSDDGKQYVGVATDGNKTYTIKYTVDGDVYEYYELANTSSMKHTDVYNWNKITANSSFTQINNRITYSEGSPVVSINLRLNGTVTVPKATALTLGTINDANLRPTVDQTISCSYAASINGSEFTNTYHAVIYASTGAIQLSALSSSNDVVVKSVEICGVFAK